MRSIESNKYLAEECPKVINAELIHHSNLIDKARIMKYGRILISLLFKK